MRKTRKKTVANDPGREIDSLRSGYPVGPLEYLMEVLNDPNLPNRLRDAAAEAALPYMHQKLKPIAVDDLGAAAEDELDLSRLTAEERDRYKQLMAKATRSHPQN
jgi:hypothetical protein